MRFTTAAFAFAAAGLAAAQTSTNAAPTSTNAAPAQSPTSSSCDAQNILDTCKASIQERIDACGGNDYICLCDNYNAMLTCYNNCPNDSGKAPTQNQVTQFCLAASPLSASSASVAKTAVKPSSTSAPATTSSGEPSSASASPTQSSLNNGGMEIAAPVGGVLAVLLGVAGLL